MSGLLSLTQQDPHLLNDMTLILAHYKINFSKKHSTIPDMTTSRHISKNLINNLYFPLQLNK